MSDKERHVLAVADAIQQLIVTRDFLALQLEHATGMLDDEEFERLAASYFSNLAHPASLEEARQQEVDLWLDRDLILDAEQLSVVLGTTVSIANVVLEERHRKTVVSNQPTQIRWGRWNRTNRKIVPIVRASPTTHQILLAADVRRRLCDQRGLPWPDMATGDDDALTMTWQLPTASVGIEILPNGEVEWWSNANPPDREYTFAQHYKDDSVVVDGDHVPDRIIDQVVAWLREVGLQTIPGKAT